MPENSTETGPALKGNAAEYPGAWIEFRITVSPPGEEARSSMALRTGSVYSQAAATPKQGQDTEKAALALKVKQMEKKINLLEAEQATRTASEVAEVAEKAALALSLKEAHERNEHLEKEITTKEASEAIEKAATVLLLAESKEHNE